MLLTLLFMAAAVAFVLAIALPRVAMQSQRTREETLIYRGEQYKRAVQLYFRKYKKYPADLDDLEKSDGIRFLRRRYKDPLTGEDEWRLIHMGPDGRFKDSLLYDKPEEEDPNGGTNTGLIQPGASIGSAAASGSPGAAGKFRGADLARASRQSAAPDITGQASPAEYMAAGLAGLAPGEGGEGGDPAANSDPANADAAADGQAARPGGAVPYPNYARVLPGQIPSPTGAGAPVNVPGTNNPYAQAAAAAYPGQAQYPSSQQSSNRRGSSRIGQSQRGFGASTGANRPGMGGMAGMPTGNVPPPGFGSPGAGRSAADLIRSLITTPRPGGLAGLRAGQAGGQGGQQQAAFAEGIAGVASKVEERGIKVYNDRESYNEWEFVYDYRQDAAMTGMMGAGPAGNINPGQPGLTAGGSLRVDPSQGVPPGAVNPGMSGGMMPAGAPGGMPQQPVAETNPPPAYDPAQQGVPSYEPPVEPPGAPTPQGSERPSGVNSRRRRNSPLPPLPGQPIYPVSGVTDPNQAAPGQPPPGGTPGQTPNPIQQRRIRGGQPGTVPGVTPGQPADPSGRQNPPPAQQP